MATTLQTLKTHYGNVMRSDFAHIPAAHLTLLTDLSAQVQAGTLTLEAAESQVIKLAAGTTSVASLSYSFFTGGVPSASGFDFLISAGGPNSNNLNSAYYQAFNTENRYINFAVNLGKGGEGATWFAANYGVLNLNDTVIKAYTAIFGAAPDAAKIDVILNAKVANGTGADYTRADYFASYGGDGLNGLGTKAALIGWLMAEAVKADVGVYAKANDAFLADLADDGVAAFRSDLLAAYGAPAATPGATLTVDGNRSISPDSGLASTKSTAGDDAITGTAGLNPGLTIDAGAGRDTINLTGTIYGKITTADGGDTVVLGELGASTATLGVPAQYGTVALGSGGNTVTLKGGMAEGTSLTAAGTGNVLHIDSGGATFAGTVSGFQTVYLHSPGLPGVTGASVIYDMVASAPANSNLQFGLTSGQVLVLKDTPYAVTIQTPAVPATGARVELHLQNFQGAPTTNIDVGPSYYSANGGSIRVISNSDGPLDNNGTLVLHVDTDSTAGMIHSESRNGALSPNYSGPFPNLVIAGSGTLTAQISNSFSNIDARQAGDLNLAYAFSLRGVATQTLRLGDGTNNIRLGFDTISADNNLTPPSMKVYLGAGVDTLSLGKGGLDTAALAVGSATSLSNLHIAGGTTLSGPPEIISFQKGVDHFVLDALVHAVSADVQVYADGKTSLQDAVIAVSAHVAANTAAVFTWNGDTYIYAQDGLVGVNMAAGANLGDGLVKLVGVTGLTVGTGAGSYDIHYG